MLQISAPSPAPLFWLIGIITFLVGVILWSYRDLRVAKLLVIPYVIWLGCIVWYIGWNFYMWGY